jgi:hypothetical protein
MMKKMMVLFFMVTAAGCGGLRAGSDGAPNERVIYEENFNDYPDGPLPEGWWAEGGQKVFIEDGRLRIVANPPGERGKPGQACTVWNGHPFSGNLRLEVDAHVLASAENVNNMNLFLIYSDPSGRPLKETRDDRPEAGYNKYHVLNGYIFTFVNGEPDTPGSDLARLRMRRCPGFELLTETFDYHCRQGVTYRLAVERRDGHLTFSIDDQAAIEATDPEPLREGLMGLRTFRTDLWWDNIRVVALE